MTKSIIVESIGKKKTYYVQIMNIWAGCWVWDLPANYNTLLQKKCIGSISCFDIGPISSIILQAGRKTDIPFSCTASNQFSTLYILQQ